MKKSCTILMLMFSALLLQAQGPSGGETKTADLMRSNGKIYVVIAVMLAILAGLIGYMIRLDRKISALE